ncbi:MAG: hypothetical protein ACKOI1_01840, partial [Bacteroidota bacterium]
MYIVQNPITKSHEKQRKIKQQRGYYQENHSPTTHRPQPFTTSRWGLTNFHLRSINQRTFNVSAGEATTTASPNTFFFSIYSLSLSRSAFSATC